MSGLDKVFANLGITLKCSLKDAYNKRMNGKDIKEQRLKDKRINAGKGVRNGPLFFFCIKTDKIYTTYAHNSIDDPR